MLGIFYIEVLMSLYLKYMIMVIQFLDKNATNMDRFIIRDFSYWSF